MWLARLARLALGSKHTYEIVFFAALTYNVLRHQFAKKKEPEWDRRSTTYGR